MNADVIDMIHTKLMLVYGNRFAQAYAGLRPEHIKADWAHELQGISAEQVKHALQNLPGDWPPNVIQFRELCKQAPARVMREALPAPKGVRMSERVREQLAQVTARVSMAEPLAWARNLKRREENGEHLTRVQRDAWRKALKEWNQ